MRSEQKETSTGKRDARLEPKGVALAVLTLRAVNSEPLESNLRIVDFARMFLDLRGTRPWLTISGYYTYCARGLRRTDREARVQSVHMHAGSCPAQLRPGIAVAKKGKVETQSILCIDDVSSIRRNDRAMDKPRARAFTNDEKLTLLRN